MNTLTEREGEYLLRFPYPLKDAFRAIFKTAVWNSTSKAFVVKSTTANRNKWNVFCSKTAELQSALAALDDAVATESEFKVVDARLAQARDTLEFERAAALQRANALRQSIVVFRAAIDRLQPIRDVAVANEVAVREAAVRAEVEMRETLKPALDVFERHRMTSLLGQITAAGRRGWPAKAWLRQHQESLWAVRDDLRDVGYAHKRLDEMCYFSLYRPDKFAEAGPLLAATLLTGLQPAPAE